jgi:hypothetical protein
MTKLECCLLARFCRGRPARLKGKLLARFGRWLLAGGLRDGFWLGVEEGV